MLALIAEHLLDEQLGRAACRLLAAKGGWSEDRLKRGFGEWSDGERERFRARLVLDDASALAWWLLSGTTRSDAPGTSATICNELVWEDVRYCRAARALLGELPPVDVAVPEGALDTRALASVVHLAEGVPGWRWTLVCRDGHLREWVFTRPDAHCKAVLRSAWLIGDGETLPTGSEWERTPSVEDVLGAARLALAEIVDERTGARTLGASATAVERARSLAELALFRLLEGLAETRGLFALNVKMGFRFGPGAAEIDLFSERLRLCIEVDGPHHFVDADAYRRDRRKDALVQRHGLWMIRLLAEDVVHRIDDVRDHVLTAVRARRGQEREGERNG